MRFSRSFSEVSFHRLLNLDQYWEIAGR